MPFKFERLDIPDVVLIKPVVFEDDRGFFMESYKFSEFKDFGIDSIFLQDNYSKSREGVLRGLHYQLNPKAQGKIVRCIKGEIFDVAVDIRIGSPWYGKWVGILLSDENKYMVWIPPGFAHGFLALKDAEIFYKVTSEYDASLDRGIIWNDPKIGISWGVESPILSEKDRNLPLLEEAENNFFYKE